MQNLSVKISKGHQLKAVFNRGLQGQQGVKGDKGDAGEQGIQGETGVAGAKGDKGDKGDTGEQGLQGIHGERGEQGVAGEKGDKGDKGNAGEGVPSCGITGQILVKKSETDYDAEWKTPDYAPLSLVGTVSDNSVAIASLQNSLSDIDSALAAILGV